MVFTFSLSETSHAHVSVRTAEAPYIAILGRLVKDCGKVSIETCGTVAGAACERGYDAPTPD